MKTLIALVLVLISGFLVFKIYSQKQINSQDKIKNSDQGGQTKQIKGPKVVIKDLEVSVEVAATEEERNKGLSGRKHLPEKSGMIFLLENERSQGFWMKGMLIPIDIIWIRRGKIVHINKNVEPPQPATPDTDLLMYFPPIPIDKVLEVNAGFSDKYGIKVGDEVFFSVE